MEAMAIYLSRAGLSEAELKLGEAERLVRDHGLSGLCRRWSVCVGVIEMNSVALPQLRKVFVMRVSSHHLVRTGNRFMEANASAGSQLVRRRADSL